VKKGIRVLIKVFAVIFAFVVILFISYEVYMSTEVIGEPMESVWLETDPFDPQSDSQLAKKDGEDFQILLFSDIHLTDDLFGDPKALNLVDDLVNDVQPDFIMTTGDNTEWSFADVVMEKLITQMETYGIPWGVTLGNHDSEGRADRNWHGNQYER
jgi:predicted MPP superfamily phosphohydrolase